MKFRAEDYFRAGTERMVQSRSLYSQRVGNALAMYCAGLAVECILRAFRWRKDQSFEGRHDLDVLFKASRLLTIHDEHLRKKGLDHAQIEEHGLALRAALGEVMALWHNNLRFASEERLRAFLREIRRSQGVKGDALKKNTLDLLNAAQLIVDQGVALWTFGKK